MIYRIAIKVRSQQFYYLTSESDNPKTDEDLDFENISFLSNVGADDIHTFSTKEIAEEVIKKLPFPYNEKAVVLEVEAIDSPIVKSSYYRILKRFTSNKRIEWANFDKSFSYTITENCAQFHELEDAEKFKNSLLGFDDTLARIVEVSDYGEPNYDFEVKILKTGKILYFRS
jgi:hypothetical protein